MAQESESEWTAADLVGLPNLQDFAVVEMTEVYKTDDDGQPMTSLGFFRDPTVAEAFMSVQVDGPHHHGTVQKLVLTNGGNVGFVILKEPVRVFDDQIEIIDIKKKVLAKLSPADRAILGYAE